MNKIYVSTNCLKNPKNVIQVLDKFENTGIENVELGSVHSSFNVKELKKYNFNFLIHNYFPPPKKPFNFNLASKNGNIRKRSKNLAKKALELCHEINSPIYTFHAGFMVDPKKLGVPLGRTEITDRKVAFENFINSVYEIIDYSKNLGIKIAFEPNVVQKFNLIKGKNELLLLAEYDEFKEFYKNINKKDLGILLDLGHTAVTSYWLKFNKDEFVKNCMDKIIAIHISNNNGKQDQHKSLTKDCWQVKTLKNFRNCPIILETMNLTTEKIISNINIVKNTIKNQK